MESLICYPKKVRRANKIGQWPWRREVFARVFSNLNAYNPKSVGLDVVMSEQSRFGKEDDRLLSDALSNAKYPIVIPVEALSLNVKRVGVSTSTNFLLPLSVFLGHENVDLGHVNLINDRDGIVRSLPSEIADNKGVIYKGLAYKTVEKSGAEIKNIAGIRSVERIVFSGPGGSIRRVPLWKVLDKSIAPEVLNSKIIYIGATAADLHDEKPTPFDKGTQMSGVEIQAQTGNMFLSGYRLRNLDTIVLFLWLLFASLVPCIVFYFIKAVQRAILLNVGFGVIYLVLMVLLFDKGVVASFVYINIAWLASTLGAFFYRFLSIDREKREIREVFSKYVSKDVLDEILKDVSKVKLGGEEREVTIFFSDVRSFTALSEGMTPDKLTSFLNKYLTRMTNIILSRKGVVDKYIGDAIMSFWGAPIDNENQALDAVLSALEMMDSLEDLNKINEKIGDPGIDIGIGLNTGVVTVGNMGSEVRLDYTVMGDAVNLASRLESQTKNYHVKIIISESTKARIKDEDIKKHKILIREIDKITVKGKTKPVTIFEVVARVKEGAVGQIIDDFSSLRALYYKGSWSEGVMLAEKILKKFDDGPTRVIMERCEYFSKHEPQDWVGVFEMTNK